MSKLNQVMGLGILVLSAAAANVAYAGVTDIAGTWAGDGAVFNPSGQELSQFGAEMDNTIVGQNGIESKVTISLPDGTQKIFYQTIQQTDHGFSITSDLGNGGGYCLGEGICLSYIDAGQGHAYATTIILDGSTAERVLVTELQNGKAVSLMREKYVKIN